MTIRLTAAALREIWPGAPQGVIDDFVAKQHLLDAAGISHTRTRLAIALSQVEHETAGFSIPNLTENINYSHARAAAIWPSRFKSADDVRRKYGSARGWQLKMFDDVYGNRMGNRPSTSDGSRFIGRGGPQVTGRGGYREVGRRAGLPLETAPELASMHDKQAAILAGFWSWKNLNPVADAKGLRGVTRIWNGGFIGMADREAALRGNDPVVARLEKAQRALEVARTLPGAPPTPEPPKAAIREATKNERKARHAGAALGGAGGVNEGVKTGTVHPGKPDAVAPTLPPQAAYAIIAVGLAVAIVATVVIWRKTRAVKQNWF